MNNKLIAGVGIFSLEVLFAGTYLVFNSINFTFETVGLFVIGLFNLTAFILTILGAIEKEK